MKLTSLEEEFNDVGIIVGSVFLLRPKDALQMLNRCMKKKIGVAGVEGFKMIGKKIQPLQEHSIDLEDKDLISHDSFKILEAFIRERQNENLWFEIVTVDK